MRCTAMATRAPLLRAHSTHSPTVESTASDPAARKSYDELLCVKKDPAATRAAPGKLPR